MKKFIAACGVSALMLGLASCGGSSSTATGFDDSVSVYFGKVNGAALAQNIENAPGDFRSKINNEELFKGVKTVLMNDTANISFLIGLQVGMQLNQGLIQFAEGAEFDRATVLKAFKETLNADSVDFEQLRMTLDSLMNIVQDRVAKKLEEKKQNDPVSIQNRITGKAFIDKLIKEDASVKQTESGLAYKVVTEGTGAKPVVTDRVVVMYKGMLIDGTEFDSSKEPVEFPVTGVIAGFSEGLQLMNKGGKAIFYIPGDLGYGIDGAPGAGIGPNSTLIFEVELIDIIK